MVFKLKNNNKLIKSTLCFSNLGSTRDSVKILHFKPSTISHGPHGGPALGVLLVPLSGHTGSHCHRIRVRGSSMASQDHPSSLMGQKESSALGAGLS